VVLSRTLNDETASRVRTGPSLAESAGKPGMSSWVAVHTGDGRSSYALLAVGVSSL